MRIDQYPISKLDKLLLAAQELAESNEEEHVKINIDRPVDIINGVATVTGPTIITITVERKYKNI
jgi:hypothetical protein